MGMRLLVLSVDYYRTMGFRKQNKQHNILEVRTYLWFVLLSETEQAVEMVL